MKSDIHIIIAEPSLIISRGLKSIIQASTIHNVSVISSFEEIQGVIKDNIINVVVISPSGIQNNFKAFSSIRGRLENTRWIALLYAYHEQNLLSLFDASITISDNAEKIISTLEGFAADDYSDHLENIRDTLSEREVDVLKLLTSGMANKEIADKLNISINTVITHRKNISQKTGIKSVSGLTIYAVVKKHITIENLKS